MYYRAVDSREPLGICTITFTHHPDSRTIVFVKKGYHSPSPEGKSGSHFPMDQLLVHGIHGKGLILLLYM